MLPNPGGIITGNAIIDREQEIATIWRTLQNQSVVLSSERRVGKTSILRKRAYKFRYALLQRWWKVNRA